MTGDSILRLRGGCVGLQGRAMLITGETGMGKSSLALDLMALGAGLVSDDWTEIRPGPKGLMADAPDSLRGKIEARGIGILAAEAIGPLPLAWVVELGAESDQRLPPSRELEIAGVLLPLVKAAYRPHLGAALRQMLVGGRLA